MPDIIAKIKQWPIAVATVAAFTAGTWTGNNMAGQKLYENPVEGAKVFECSVVDSVSPVLSRPYLVEPIHVPAGCNVSVMVYGVNQVDSVRQFIAEIPYEIPAALHTRYGLVQFNPDFSIQSDAPIEGEKNEIIE